MDGNSLFIIYGYCCAFSESYKVNIYLVDKSMDNI